MLRLTVVPFYSREHHEAGSMAFLSPSQGSLAAIVLFFHLTGLLSFPACRQVLQSPWTVASGP